MRLKTIAMRILITNDDGYEAYGLEVLYKIASALSDEVWVVAPHLEQSGKGRGVSLSEPMRLHHRGERRYSIMGTPSDCVQVAVNHILPEKPDLILSGVNRGFNLAQDVTMSGTVGAAFQGMSLGIASMALSQCLDFDLDVEAQWQSSLDYGALIVSQLLNVGWKKNTILNINFPDCPKDEVTGVEITRQGLRDQHEMHAIKCSDPRGRTYFWMDFHDFEQDQCDGSDLKAIAEKRISITPLHLDLTDYDGFVALNRHMESMGLNDRFKDLTLMDKLT